MKRFASHFLYLSSDNCFKQYVVELKDGCAYRIFPLTEEIESTIWLGGTIILSTSASAIGNISVNTDGYVQSDIPVYAYLVTDGNTWKRLL